MGYCSYSLIRHGLCSYIKYDLYNYSISFYNFTIASFFLRLHIKQSQGKKRYVLIGQFIKGVWSTMLHPQDRCLALMSTMTFDWWMMLELRKMSSTLVKSFFAAGTRGTSTFFPLVDGNLMILRRNGISIRYVLMKYCSISLFSLQMDTCPRDKLSVSSIAW